MNQTTSNTCQNCNTKNDNPFQYCSNCGQKNTDGKITFSELWSEFQDAVFNIESRTWRTFKSLFKPGKLTSEYFAGKHRRYVHPLRLLLVSSILLILAMSFQDFQSLTNHPYDIKEVIQKNYERKRMYKILGNIIDTTNTNFPNQQTEIITDTISSLFVDSMIALLPEYNGGNYLDSLNLTWYAGFGTSKAEWISKDDFLNKHEDELLEIYKKDAGSFDRLFFKQKIKHIKDESKITTALVGQTTWVALLMMPFIALILYLLNIRHQYYYIEHLIFTFHLHSFSFLVLALLIAGLHIFPWWMFVPFLVVIGIYVFLSMLKVYQQSVGKTVIKFLLLSTTYVGLFFLFIIGTIIFTFFLL